MSTKNKGSRSPLIQMISLCGPERWFNVNVTVDKFSTENHFL